MSEDRKDILEKAQINYYNAIDALYYESFLTIVLAANKMLQEGIHEIKFLVCIEEQSDAMTITQPHIFVKEKAQDDYYTKYDYIWWPEIYLDNPHACILDNKVETQERSFPTLHSKFQASLHQIIMALHELPLNAYSANNCGAFERSQNWKEQKLEHNFYSRINKRIFITDINSANLTQIFNEFEMPKDMESRLLSALIIHNKEKLDKTLSFSQKTDIIRQKI